MLIMVSNQTGIEIGYLAAKYPGRLGHLFSPGAARGPWHFMPYALDNGAWPAHKNGHDWDERDWRYLLLWSLTSGQPPLWALVPDSVGDRDNTLRKWERYSSDVKSFGMRAAFAAQDGMTPGDVPDDDCVIFIGGSTDWKLAAIRPWAAAFPGRVHVGRVTTLDRLLLCWRAGVVSVDGTGWFRKRKGQNQRSDLLKFLRETDSRIGSSPI